MNHARLLRSRLAARLGIRQVQVLTRADRLAVQVEQAIASRLDPLQFQRQLRLTRDATLWSVLALVQNQLQTLSGELHHALALGLRSLALWGHHSAAQAAIEVLPETHLRALTEAAAPDPAYSLLVFAPPTQSEVEQIVYGVSAAGPWEQRLAAATRLAQPHQIAGVITQGLIRGDKPEQIAAELRPVVQGVRNSARRIARFETLRVAHETQMRTWEQMGDLVIGYQINATLDSHTRAWHASRHGTAYYREPAANQKGLDQMPRPPMEAADPRERPAGTPQHAWGCRCFLTPVLKPAQAIADDPEKQVPFVQSRDQLVPDPTTYADWWETAEPKERRLTVGSRRYYAVAQRLPRGETPRWEHFISHETGDLLPIAQLASETRKARSERTAKVQGLLAHLRQLIQQAALFGFVQR